MFWWWFLPTGVGLVTTGTGPGGTQYFFWFSLTDVPVTCEGCGFVGWEPHSEREHALCIGTVF